MGTNRHSFPIKPNGFIRFQKDGTIETVDKWTGIFQIGFLVPYTVKNSDELFNTISSIKNDLR